MERAPVDAPRRPTPPRDRVTDLFLGLAVLWSAALVLLAAVVHVAGPTVVGVHPDGVRYATTTPARTLIQSDGLKVELLVLLPLIAVVTTALALHHRRSHGRPDAGPVARAVTGV